MADTLSVPAALAAVATLTTLSACGGGGSGGFTPSGTTATGPTTPPSTASQTPTEGQAVRFLIQAAFGATDAQVREVQQQGYAAWIAAQMALPVSEGHAAWMQARGYQVPENIDNFTGVDNTLWRKLLSAPDVLRQRIALALSEIFVVSMAGVPVAWRGFLVASYMDTLERHAFGTYRELLEAVTLSPAMGTYLNLRGSQRATAAGRQPDENYAREVLQLFSIGLVELNADGSLRRSAQTGQPLETYSQDTVTQLARALTGWEFDGFTRADPAWTRRPMVSIAARHDDGVQSFLGITIPAGTSAPEALRRALDALAAHPNVGPFLGRQLIQRLVTSNPSPAYVARVSAVFADNGRGQRGDLAALIRAILLDSEARSEPGAIASTAATAGRLLEPVVRFVQWGRTFGVRSPTGVWNVGNTSDPATRLGQSPLRAPSVFNFFRPGYVPPGTPLAAQAAVAPEFQLLNETTATAWVNFAQTFVASGVGEVVPDYTAELALASQADALVQRVAARLLGGSPTPALITLITTAVGSINATTDAGRLNRVRAAVLLVLASPDYLVQA